MKKIKGSHQFKIPFSIVFRKKISKTVCDDSIRVKGMNVKLVL